MTHRGRHALAASMKRPIGPGAPSRILPGSMRSARIASLLFLAAILAYALPLHFAGVARQLLGGDEEHALGVALERGFGGILTHYSGRDNSIPLTLYARAALGSAGLSEMGMRW